MELSDAEIRRIASFGRSLAKAPAMDVIGTEAFKTLKAIADIRTVAIVHQFE